MNFSLSIFALARCAAMASTPILRTVVQYSPLLWLLEVTSHSWKTITSQWLGYAEVCNSPIRSSSKIFGIIFFPFDPDRLYWPISERDVTVFSKPRMQLYISPCPQSSVSFLLCERQYEQLIILTARLTAACFMESSTPFQFLPKLLLFFWGWALRGEKWFSDPLSLASQRFVPPPLIRPTRSGLKPVDSGHQLTYLASHRGAYTCIWNENIAI